MPASLTKEELFRDILVNHTSGEETIDELRDICAQHGLFDEASEDRILKSYRDRMIRKLARHRYADEQGNIIELVNIVRHDAATGTSVNKYVQLSLLGFNEQIHLVEDRLTKSAHYRGEAKRYYDDGIIKFGKKFQHKFDCF